MRYPWRVTDKAENDTIKAYLAKRRAVLRGKTRHRYPSITEDCCTIGQYIAAWEKLNYIRPTTYAPTFDPSQPWWPEGFNTETVDLVTEEHDCVAQP
jgi:hypothetical protein